MTDLRTDQLVDQALDVALRRRALDPAIVEASLDAEALLGALAQAVEHLAPTVHDDPRLLRVLAAGLDAWSTGLDAAAAEASG